MAGVPGALGLGPGLQGGVTLLLRPSPSSHVSAVVGMGQGPKPSVVWLLPVHGDPFVDRGPPRV